ncbi:hypothetical protein MMM6_07950 [Helicobacter pylori]
MKKLFLGFLVLPYLKIVSMVESPFDKGVLIVAYEKCLEFKKELNHE